LFLGDLAVLGTGDMRVERDSNADHIRKEF